MILISRPGVSKVKFEFNMSLSSLGSHFECVGDSVVDGAMSP